jgi:hypothetical protein
MLLIVAGFLIVLWLLAFFVLHVTSALIHILVVVAIIMLVMHLVRGRRAA